MWVYCLVACFGYVLYDLCGCFGCVCGSCLVCLMVAGVGVLCLVWCVAGEFWCFWTMLVLVVWVFVVELRVGAILCSFMLVVLVFVFVYS